MYKRIMVPVDGSTFSEFAIPVALGVAEASGATVELVNVQAPLPAMAEDRWAAAVEEWGRPYLEALQAKIEADSGVRVGITCLVGTVTRELELHAEKNEIDLVVMSTHGRGPISRFWIGSVADAFVRQSKIPILLVRPEKDAEPDYTHAPQFRRILLPLDGSHESEEAIDHALAIGEWADATYTIIRCVEYPFETVSPYLPDTAGVSREVVEEGKQIATEYLTGVRDRFADTGRDADTVISVDLHSATGVLEAAEEHSADLIVMTTHGRGGIARAVIGSVADKVVRSASVPVLLIRPNSGSEESA